jgi:tRNA(Ile)-lysidine synthase
MPSHEQVERFRSGVARLARGAPERIALAVSGGPDSLALLLLARGAFPGRIEAATVDHRLRKENAEEARHVASICAAFAVPHIVLEADTVLAGASLQAQARALRYRLLGRWAAARGTLWLATGHHLDDQAETLLMRLARGSGLAGLAGIRAMRPDAEVTVIRPLLGWCREELAAIVAEAGLQPVDDPSNRSDAFDRTHVRRLLRDSALLPVPRLAAAAAHLAEAEEALAWAAEREWQARARREEGAVTLDPSGLPPELLRRLACRAVETIRGSDEPWRRAKLADALAALANAPRVTIGGVQITGGTLWRFEPEPPRRAGGRAPAASL